MKSFTYPFLSIVLAGFLLTSCMQDDEKSDLTNYCNISKFSLNTLRLAHNVKGSQGQDSIFYTSYSGIFYPMSIDQRNNVIENRDSLPYNTVPSKVLTNCTFETLLVHRPLDISGLSPEDTLWTGYNKKDTVDFSAPREYRVYSSDGTSMRRYTVKVNIRQMDPLATIWDSLGVHQPIPSQEVKERRLAVVNGQVVLLIEKTNGTLQYFVRPAQTSGEWRKKSLDGADGAIISTLQNQGGMLYLSTEDGKILCSADGQNWRTRMLGRAGLRLVGVSERCFYALHEGKLLATPLSEENWKEQVLDDEATLLPEKDITLLLLVQSNGDKRLLMTGKSADGKSARLWAKLFSGKNKAEEEIGWSYYTENAAISKTFPLMEQSCVMSYDNGVIAFGSTPKGSEDDPLKWTYQSLDCGITWTIHDEMRFDDRMKAQAKDACLITAASEDGRFIWMLIDGELWRGRLNRAAF